MKRFKALLTKDWLLLVRDRWGLALLFLMPWALVLLMTYLQDSTFRTINENRIPLCLLNADNDSLGNLISRQMYASGIFEISETVNGKSLTENEVEENVSRGDFLLGVVIPAQSTERLREQVQWMTEQLFGADSLPERPSAPEIKLWIDPAAKSSFRTTLTGAVRENAIKIQNKLLFNEIAHQINRLAPLSVALDFDTDNMIAIRDAYALSAKTKIIPNSIQHNVPAWSMFAVFFIVISLAGNMINEKEIGCYNRLMTMPCSFSLYVLSKITVHLLLCLLQFALMMLTGMYLAPLLGLPSLKLGHSLFALGGMATSASLAATGYGLAIGSVARTNQQASVFGAVSVVILAAVGGVWVPTFIMPYFMRILSRISPLNWGLNGFNEIFVRDAGCRDVLPYMLALLLFFAITLFISYRSDTWQKKR